MTGFTKSRIVGSIVCLIGACACWANEYVIEVEAGSETLSDALAEVAEFRETDETTPVVLSLGGGLYNMPSGVSITSKMADSSFGKLTIRAADPTDKPRLSAYYPVTGWTRLSSFNGRSGVWYASTEGLSIDLRTTSFWFNGNRMEWARWPNYRADYPYSSGWAYPAMSNPDYNNKNAIPVRDEDLARVARWTNPSEGYFYGTAQHNWSSRCYAILDLVDGWLLLDTPSATAGGSNRFGRYYICGIREELDVEGECYYDREAERIYFIPPAGENPNSGVSGVGASSTLFSAGKVGNFALENIEFCQAVKPVQRTNVGDVEVQGCLIHDCGCVTSGNSVFAAQSAERLSVTDCEFAHLCGGLSITTRSGTTSYRSGVVFANNYLHHANTSMVTGGGLSVNGQDILISHNLIHDLPRSAIAIMGRLVEVSYNRIHHVNTCADDSGAIYICSWESGAGCRFANNWISDSVSYAYSSNETNWVFNSETYGIYCDEGSGGVEVTGNLLRRCRGGGIYLHCARHITISNNVFVSNGPVPYTAWSSRQLSASTWNRASHDAHIKSYSNDYARVVNTDPAWLDYPCLAQTPYGDETTYNADGTVIRGLKVVNNVFHYPDRGAASGKSCGVVYGVPFLDMTTNEFENNLFWPGEGNWFSCIYPDWTHSTMQLPAWQEYGQDLNSVVADPLAADPSHDDYRLAVESPAFDLGFVDLPYSEMGLTTSVWRASLPIEEEGLADHPEWLAQPPPEESHDYFRLVVDGETAGEYGTLCDAVDALNAKPASSVCAIELLGNATFDESVSILHDKVTLRSAGDSIYTLTRTDANACIFFGATTNETIMIPAATKWTMDITNITIDGGAVWTSPDISNIANSGVGAGMPVLFTIGAAWNQYCTLNLNGGATIQNVQTGSNGKYEGAVNTAKAHSYSANTARINMNAGSKITQCRGASAALFMRLNGTDQVAINGGEISYCSSTDNGGAVYMYGNGNVNLKMSGGSIHHCRAKNGGGMYLTVGYLQISGGEIYENTATQNGGGVWSEASWSSIAGDYSGGTIRDNVAGTNGGGVYINPKTRILTVGGSMRIKGNTANSATSNLHGSNNLNAGTFAIGSTLADDHADIGLTLASGLVNAGNIFATAASGLTDADLVHLHLDANDALMPTVEGTDIKWASGTPPVVATVTASGISTDYDSFYSALEQANAKTSATVTLHADVTISYDYTVSGNVTLDTDAVNGVTVSRNGSSELAVEPSGKLTFAGESMTVNVPVAVASGATLTVAANASPSFGGAISLADGSTFALAGAPTFAYMPVFPNATTLMLSGPLTGDVSISYPANGEEYYEVAFGRVADNYTATATDLGHLVYAYSAVEAEAYNGSVRWSSDSVNVARVGETEYTSFAEAVDAANLLEDHTVELLRNVTIDSRICVTSSMTIASAEGVSAKISRTSSNAGFDIGKNANGETVIAKNVTLTFRDIVIDGGAIWTSSDVTDTANTGIGADQPLFTAVGTGSNSAIKPTYCGKLVFGSGTEVRNQAGPVAYLDYHTRFAFETGASVHDCRTWSGHLFFCRTSSFEFAGEVRNCTAGNTARAVTSDYALFYIDQAASNYWKGSPTSITSGLITGCFLKSGAIRPKFAELTMSGGEISGNRGGNGVAIHCQWQGTRTLHLTGGVITNNTVETADGAAIYVSTQKALQNKNDHSASLFVSGDVVIKDNWYKNGNAIRRRNIFSAREHESVEQWYNVLIGGPLTGEVQVTWPESGSGSYSVLADVIDVPFGAVDSGVYSPTPADAHHMVYEGSPVQRKQVVGRVDRANGKLVWGLTGKETVFILR